MNSKRLHIPLITATTRAWDGMFKGDLADVLLETITDHLNKDRSPYARLTGIINSSGTGKSRMVDQLGKEIITVPMCPRLKRSDGLSNNQTSVQQRLHRFANSLIMVTLRELETISKEGGDYLPTAPQITCQWRCRYTRVTLSR